MDSEIAVKIYRGPMYLLVNEGYSGMGSIRNIILEDKLKQKYVGVKIYE